MIKTDKDVSIQEFWTHLYDRFRKRLAPAERLVMEHILFNGTLASRILQALDGNYSRHVIRNCLPFVAIMSGKQSIISLSQFP